MLEKMASAAFFRLSLKAGLAVSLAALLAAPGWAQRPGMGRPAGPPPSMPQPMPMPQPNMGPRPMPPMSRPAPMPPPAPMPRTEPMPRQAPMPAPRPERSPRTDRPVPSAPPLRAHPRLPLSPTTTSTSNAKQARPTSTAGRARTSEPFVPLTSETGRLPVYSHVSGEAYLQRLARVKALLNQAFLSPQPNNASIWYGNPWDAAYWGEGFWGGGFWGMPMFMASGLYCDPFNNWFVYSSNPYGFLSPGSTFYYFPASLFTASLINSPFSCFSPPYSSGLFNLYAGGASYCPLCTNSSLGLWNLGFYNPFGFLTTPASSSLALSSGLTPRSTTGDTGTTGSLFASASATSSAPLYRANAPPPGQPVTLVFNNGKSVEATQYWLSNGQLDYVTTMGVRKAVPLQNFDMNATMQANQRNGVSFLLPTVLHAQSQSQKH